MSMTSGRLLRGTEWIRHHALLPDRERTAEAAAKEFGRKPNDVVALLVDGNHVVAVIEIFHTDGAAQMAGKVLGILRTGYVVVPRLKNQRGRPDRGHFLF